MSPRPRFAAALGVVVALGLCACGEGTARRVAAAPSSRVVLCEAVTAWANDDAKTALLWADVSAAAAALDRGDGEIREAFDELAAARDRYFAQFRQAPHEASLDSLERRDELIAQAEQIEAEMFAIEEAWLDANVAALERGAFGDQTSPPDVESLRAGARALRDEADALMAADAAARVEALEAEAAKAAEDVAVPLSEAVLDRAAQDFVRRSC